MSKSTKVFTDVFKGHPVVAVWNVDEAGNKVGKYPVASMGIKKSIAFLEHQEAIMGFVKEHLTAAKEA